MLRPLPAAAVPLVPLALAIALALPGGSLGAQEEELVDRVLAVVDEDPILASDVERTIALGLAEPRPQEDRRELEQRVLEGLIEQRLRFHEVDRFGFGQVPVEEIAAQVELIRSRFPSEEAFQQRLAELQLGEEDLAQLVARQMMILAYVDERLGARVFVSLEDIRAYYQQELVPAMEERGEAPPPIEEVREQIRTIVRERRLVEEIERWTRELYRNANVEIYSGRGSDGELPPVVETFEGGPP